MATYAFLLDLARCIGCQACVAACKTGNELPQGAQFIHLIEQTRGEFPKLEGGFKNHRCYHCTDAACVAVCPTGALYKEDGLTRLNSAKCSGCTYCVDACPFGVPTMVNERASKCDACKDVVAAGGKPWCVKTCPSNALMYGARDEILAEAHQRDDASLVGATGRHLGPAVRQQAQIVGELALQERHGIGAANAQYAETWQQYCAKGLCGIVVHWLTRVRLQTVQRDLSPSARWRT